MNLGLEKSQGGSEMYWIVFSGLYDEEYTKHSVYNHASRAFSFHFSLARVLRTRPDEIEKLVSARISSYKLWLQPV